MKGIPRDIIIRVAGLLQSVIASGADPDEWKDRLYAALKLHQETCIKLSGGNYRGKPAEVNKQ